MKKILITCICLGLAGVFAFAISWGVINFNKVKEGMSGTGVYTEQDLNKAYEDGYGQGIKDKAEYLILIDEYRNTITTLNDTISQLNFQVNTLTANNKDYEIQLESLKAQRTTLENEVAELELDKENNEATIYKLNNQIISLNKQISDLSNLTQTASSQITALNNRVNELQSSVNYYESFIAQMENGEQVVATYEVDGTVWKIEILNKGTEITFTSPANTETTIFNGWQIDGTEELLGNTYTINANTKFVADITYKHQVTFMVDEQVYDNQYVIENEFATIPELPVKEGYQFLGWSLNRIDVIEGIDTTAVNEATTYYAVFSKIHTVTFMVDNEVIATQKVVNGNYADNVEVQTDGFFNGWLCEDILIDLSSYQINNDVIFIAEILRDNWAVTSFNGLDSFTGNQIWSDGENTYYSKSSDQFILNSETKTWIPIQWSGLTNFNGKNVWTDGSDYYYSYNENQYQLKKGTQTWVSIAWNGLTKISGENIWSDGNNYYYNNYVLDKTTKTWTKKTFNGFESFSAGKNVWSDGTNIYYSVNSVQYKLDVSTLTWGNVSWSNIDYLNATYVWTDGKNYYYSSNSSQYFLDTKTNNAIKINWTGLSSFTGDYVWTDGTNIYYSLYSKHYVLKCNMKI